MNLINNNLSLRELTSENAAELFTLTENNRVYLRKTLPWLDAVKTVEDSLKFITDAIENRASGKNAIFGIWIQESLVGIVGFNSIKKINKSADIGYWLAQSYSGQGIMTRACRMLIQYGFEELKLHRIEIGNAVGNPASGAVAKKLGFKKEGVMRDAQWIYDRFEDIQTWSLLEGELYQ